MKTILRVLLPYLGAFTLAAILACPRAEAETAKGRLETVCRAESQLVGAIADSRDHGYPLEDEFQTIAGFDGATKYQIAHWAGVASFLYYSKMTKSDAMETYYGGCLKREHVAAM